MDTNLNQCQPQTCFGEEDYRLLVKAVTNCLGEANKVIDHAKKTLYNQNETIEVEPLREPYLEHRVEQLEEDLEQMREYKNGLLQALQNLAHETNTVYTIRRSRSFSSQKPSLIVPGLPDYKTNF